MCVYTSDQSRASHSGGQVWVLQGSVRGGGGAVQAESSWTLCSEGETLLLHSTSLVLRPPLQLRLHSDQSPVHQLAHVQAHTHTQAHKHILYIQHKAVSTLTWTQLHLNIHTQTHTHTHTHTHPETYLGEHGSELQARFLSLGLLFLSQK